jgi:hypothetical protein
MTAGGFVAAVEEFRSIAQNPALPLPLKARAWGGVVRYAAMLDPHETGFERAGVALKGALSLWLDVRSAQPHCDSRLAA